MLSADFACLLRSVVLPVTLYAAGRFLYPHIFATRKIPDE